MTPCQCPVEWLSTPRLYCVTLSLNLGFEEFERSFHRKVFDFDSFVAVPVDEGSIPQSGALDQRYTLNTYTGVYPTRIATTRSLVRVATQKFVSHRRISEHRKSSFRVAPRHSPSFLQFQARSVCFCKYKKLDSYDLPNG